MRESSVNKKIRAKAIYRVLTKNYPNVRCELNYSNPFELLVATVLSAQCTDKRVNQTTPALFKKYNTIKKMAAADKKDLERLIKSTGFFRAKAKNIKSLSQKILIDFYSGSDKSGMETTLSGVNRFIRSYNRIIIRIIL